MASAPAHAPYPGKSPDLISLGDGLNFSSPLAQIVSGTIVPNALFFVRSNHPPPRLAAHEWRLRVDGRVRNPLMLGLDQLRRFPSQTHEIWLECAGNSRRRFDPPGEGNQWDDQAISNARFTGVPLRTILEQAGLDDDAVEVVATGADADSFQRALPIDVALQPEVLLAWAMNGEPILPPNGGPARLIVPRWAGIASVKWPVHLEMVNTPFRGYWNVDRYVMVDENGRSSRPVREMPVKAIIAWPTEGASVAAHGRVTVFGFAWSGAGQIVGVEVSTDDRQTWHTARLIHGGGPVAWTRWEYDWTPTAADVVLAARATDSAGNVQPDSVAWNKFGYQMNAVITRRVAVQPDGG